MPRVDRPNTDAAVIAARDLREEHVEALFLEFLGREASPEDVEVWMRIGSLRAFVDGVLASEEYLTRAARRAADRSTGREGPFLNLWTAELERFCRPAGTISADGVAIVGKRGHLFLYGGSNNNLAMYRGEVVMAGNWSAQWRELMEERLAHAQAAGLSICCLVVPDKLAVYAELFPGDLENGAPRPVVRLIEGASLPLLYPCEALRAARSGGDTYMMTDSHLTVRGNRLLAEATIGALGTDPRLLDCVPTAQEPQLTSGDLGQHFDPPIMEVHQLLSAASAATIVFDNWPEVSRAGGHIGTLRIFRRADAPDARTAVVFGDSYGFGDEAYPGLSWFLAQVFREVHFVWVPFGWDPGYVERAGAQVVVCQTAERFIARVPHRRVDVESLVREIDDRGGTHGLERAFGDAEVVGG